MRQWLRDYTTGNIGKPFQHDCECDSMYKVYKEEVIRDRK